MATGDVRATEAPASNVRCWHTSPDQLALTDDAIRELARHRGDPVVTSIYLDVSRRSRPEVGGYRVAFEHLAHGMRRRARFSGDPRLRSVVDTDLEHMAMWVWRDHDRSATRGVALFSSSEQDFFKVVELVRPVRDHAGLGPAPHVSQLLAALGRHHRFLAVVFDGECLRLPAEDAVDAGDAGDAVDAVDGGNAAAGESPGGGRGASLVVAGTGEAFAGLRDHLPADGVLGLEATWRALARREVGTLLVADGRRASGAGGVDDAVEEAVAAAVASGAGVLFCRGAALDRHGGIAAVVRR